MSILTLLDKFSVIRNRPTQAHLYSIALINDMLQYQYQLSQ
jgi:hypothetical protein